MDKNRLTDAARRLRTNPTEAEKRLWSRLRVSQLGVGFRRQFRIGDFVVDFACPSVRLVVEVDGGQHADSPSDAARKRAIEANGYRVIRFWNNEVLQNTDGVLQVLMTEIAIAQNRT